MVRSWRAARWLLAVTACFAGIAVADGGRVLLSESSGPFLVTIFAAPSPLRVGPADLTVLVQGETGAPVLDARVTLALSRISDARPPARLLADRGQATNQFLYAARAELTEAGPWCLRVDVGRGAEQASIETTLEVAPEASPVMRYWPWLAIVPVVIAVFLLHQWLRDRQALRGGAR